MLKGIGRWFRKHLEKIPLGIGILCLLSGAALVVDPVRLFMHGIRTDAVVTNVVERTVRDAQRKERVELTATIRFKVGARDVEIRRFWSRDRDGTFFCFTGCYAKGEKLKVRYLADNPEIAKVDSFLGLFGTPIALGLIGSMGIFFWRLWRSETDERASQ